MKYILNLQKLILWIYPLAGFFGIFYSITMIVRQIGIFIMTTETETTNSYDASNIRVLEGLEAVQFSKKAEHTNNKLRNSNIGNKRNIEKKCRNFLIYFNERLEKYL